VYSADARTREWQIEAQKENRPPERATKPGTEYWQLSTGN
jgi:hypothetical protein